MDYPRCLFRLGFSGLRAAPEGMWTDFVHVVESKEAMEGKACYKNDSIS